MRMLFCLLSMLLATPASAWDASLLADVRFSSDGRYFSFVEYGEITETDGEAFASMYVIDTASDSWVSGTPLKVELNGPDANEANVLRAIRRKGGQLVAQYGLRDTGGSSVGFVDVDRSDPHRRRWATPVPVLGMAMLKLDERPATAAHFCNEDYGDPSDFRLVIDWKSEPLVLADYRGSLPRSRGCATSYDIAAVYVYRAREGTVLSVLVGVYTPGWEGSDRRLIAVTKRLP